MFKLAIMAIVLLTACGGTVNQTTEETCYMSQRTLAKNAKLTIGSPQVGAFQMQTEPLKESEYHTVQLGVSGIDDIIYAAEARIVFSTGGSDVTRRVSIVNGAAISGSAEMVKVSVSDTSDPSSPNVGSQYVVDVLVTKGCRPSVQQPPRLGAGTFTIAGSGTETVIIPQDAGVISVNISAAFEDVTPIVDGDLIVNIGNPGAPLSLFSAAGDGQGWVPVPPGATKLILANTAGKNMIVGVQFGIEG